MKIINLLLLSAVTSAGLRSVSGQQSSDFTFTLEARSQLNTATKCGELPSFKACPPLQKCYTNLYISDEIPDILFSASSNCSDPYWRGSYSNYLYRTYSGNCNVTDFYQGGYNWNRMGGDSGYGVCDWDGSWWVYNYDPPLHTNEIAYLPYVWFWVHCAGDNYNFWSRGDASESWSSPWEWGRTTVFTNCTLGPCGYDYVAGTSVTYMLWTNEFTTLTLITSWLQTSPTNEWLPCGKESPHGWLWLTEDEMTGAREMVEIRFKVDSVPPNQPFQIDYLLCRQWLSNDVPVVTKTKKNVRGTGTGGTQYISVDLAAPYSTTSTNGCLYYHGETNWIEVQCAASGCAGCSQTPGAANVALTDGGISIQAELGPAAYGVGSSAMRLTASSPSPALTTPAALELSGDLTGADVIRANGALRQVRNAGSLCLADIQTQGATSFTIAFYDQFGPLTGGLYDLSGQNPISTTAVAQGSSTNQVVVTISNGNTRQYIYDWSAADQGWILTSGNGLRKESRIWNPTLLVRTNTIRDSLNNIIHQEVKYYTDLANYGRVLTKQVVGPSGPALTTQYFYYDNQAADGTNYGNLKMVVQPSGFWQRYEYDTQNRVLKEISQFLNAATNAPENQCRVVQYDYTPLDGTNDSETRIEKLLGVEVAREYSLNYPSGNRTARCSTPGASWTNSGNLVTTTTYVADDPSFAGYPKSTVNPDGTLQIYSYAYLPDGRKRTAVSTGAPDSTWTTVTNGTKVISDVDSKGQVYIPQTCDIALGSQLGQDYPVNADTQWAFDSLGRRYVTWFTDGTLEQINYGCCGIESVINRDGSTTTHVYDGLNRDVGTLRNGITTSNVLDAAGNVLATIRVGTDGKVIINQQVVFDVAGRLIFETNALGGSTSYLETKDGNGQTVKTITYPDGGTRIETYYQDGSLQKVTGTAVFPVRYEYGVENDGSGATTAYTKEVKLDSSYQDTAEWTKTYTDMLGRTYKTVYSAANQPFPEHRSFYNALGQLSREVDPDGVTTLYQYNPKGELECTATDMNANNSIDFAGSDRITRTVTDYVMEWGLACKRTCTYAWPQDGSDSALLVGLNVTTPASDHSISVAGGLTNTIEMVPSGDQRTTTITAPDASETQTIAQCGTNVSTVRSYSQYHFETAHITYAYDAFGRQNQLAERRPDGSYATNISYFNNADQLSSSIAPAPAPGQGPQVTTNFFDSIGRILKTTLADGTSVTNEYFPTGLLKKTYGSRTYPVEYTYDAQGRMRTMKTWQNLALNSGTATTTWNYDANRGWLRNKVYADGQGPLYTNTPAGRLYTRTWARGITTTYAYNNAGDLSNVAYSDTTPAITYGYDRQGRRTSAAQGSSSQSFCYSDTGLLLSEAFTAGPLAGLSITNICDEFLRRTNFVLRLSNNPFIQQSFSYDASSRLQTVTDGPDSATYSYVDYSSLVRQIDFAHNAQVVMSTTKQYDWLNRLTNITTVDASLQTLDSHAYGYNSANQRTNCALADSSFWVYQYDVLGQVISGRKYWQDGTPMAGQQFTYAFDDIGNRRVAGSGGDRFGGNLHVQNYSANTLNQYTSRTVPGYVQMLGTANASATVTLWGPGGSHATTSRKGDYFWGELLVGNGTYAPVTNVAVLNNGSNPDIVSSIARTNFLPQTPESFGYDLDGNLTNDGRWSYTWDAENRLTRMVVNTSTGPQQRLDFGYDPQGRRITKRVWPNTSGTGALLADLKFLYDEWNLLSELNATNNGVIRSYLWGLDLSGSLQGAGGVGGLLKITYNGTSTTNCFAAYDANGNVSALIDAGDGTSAARYGYGPFGEVLRGSGPMASEFNLLFSTKLYEWETGRYYYGYRYYDPSTGRWLSRDPLGEAGGANLYGFVGNSPLTRVDVGGEIGLDTALDLLVLGVDLSTGAGLATIALDVAALAVPLGPNPRGVQIITRILNGEKKRYELVDHALLRAVADEPQFKGLIWNDLASRPQRASIVLEYQGRIPNQAGNKWVKHFEFFAGDAAKAQAASRGPTSYFAPGIDDAHVRVMINEALRKHRAEFSHTHFSQLNNYVYDAGLPFGRPNAFRTTIGYSKGECTTRIKLKVEKDGSVHAFPTLDRPTARGSVIPASAEE
ncbi:MAG TPA: RHS repeat-associated core domain-containing protein [Verrucomicrobiae bacterium]